MKKYLELTENETMYLIVVLIKYREIQEILEKKQDRQYANVMNKLTDIKRKFEGKAPISVPGVDTRTEWSEAANRIKDNL